MPIGVSEKRRHTRDHTSPCSWHVPLHGVLSPQGASIQRIARHHAMWKQSYDAFYHTARQSMSEEERNSRKLTTLRRVRVLRLLRRGEESEYRGGIFRALW